MTTPDLSVIIPSYCSQNTLARCLDALTSQSAAADCEIIVVDSSPDNGVAKICAAYPVVKCIRLSEKSSPGIARNVGADKASGEILIFLDSDVFLAPDALSKVRDYARQGYRIFGGALKVAPGSSIPCGILEHYFFNHESAPLRPLTTRKNLSSALMIIDRNIFREAGGFKNIPRMQDMELTERLGARGEKLYFIPSVTGHQLQIVTFKDLCRKIFINGNNLFFIRYSSRANPSRRFFFFLSLPLLMLAKVTRINCRNIAFHDWHGRWIAILLCPVMYFLGLFWMAGFYKALLTGCGISHER